MTGQDATRTHVHAFTADALGEHDAVGLVAELRSGRVSANEVVEAAIARTEKLQPELNGLACASFDRARAEARMPRPGYFSGVPTFVKDNSDVRGLPTQQGSSAFVARPAKADGDFARMFFAQGVVSLGKTRLSEFGFSASAEYPDADPVRNPWHTGYTSGASSAGSAAFVAAGAVPLAHANDGGGSIRIPAACNGLVGLKPTRGRTPSDKMNRDMPVRIVADGVVTRSVRDTAAFLREAEKIYRDLSLRPVGDVRGSGKKRLRVGLVIDSLETDTDAETAATVRRTAELLESLGHHVEPIDPPITKAFIGDFLTYWSLLAGFINATGKHTFDRSFDWRRTDNLTRGLAANAARHSYRLPLAIARLNATKRASARLYRDHDVVLTPTLGHVTPPLGLLDPSQSFDTVMGALLEWVTFTPLQNATGDPAISLPMGTSAVGLPIGVQLAGPWGQESRLLEVAYELEAAQPFARIQG